MTFAEIVDLISETGVETGNSIKKGAKQLSKYDKDDVLAMLGLETKRSTLGVILPAVGFFGVGILAGVGLGLLFAPKPGSELREELGEQVKQAVKKEGMRPEAGASDTPTI
jgi:hypothetical protein